MRRRRSTDDITAAAAVAAAAKENEEAATNIVFTEDRRGSSLKKAPQLVGASLRRIDYGLYATLCLRLLFPTLYSTFRVYILGSMSDAGALSIASQMAWVNVLLEVVEEGLLLPLYHCLGSSLEDRRATRNKVKTGLALSAVVYVLFSAATAALAWPLV